MKWTEEEVSTRALIATKRAVPTIISMLIHLTYSVVLAGFSSPTTAVIIGCLGVFLWALVYLWTGGINGVKWAIFVYYEVAQTVVMSAAYIEPFVSPLLCMMSTIVFATSESSPLYSKPFNILLCAKHVFGWLFVLTHSHGVQFWPHGALPVMCSTFHLMLCIDIKKKALIASSTYLEELKIQEMRLAGLLQAVPDGIVVLSEKTKIVTMNKACAKQLEVGEVYTDEDVIDCIHKLKYAEEFVGEQKECFMDDVMRFIESDVGEVFNFAPVLMGTRYLECRGSVMQWDERKVCVLIVRDSTNWIQLEKQAQKENDNKTALLRSVSHELRTPTNAILNLAIDLKSTEELTEQGKADLSMVISATSFLLSLINDLLDFSRILHDVFSLSKSYFVLEDTIKECLQLLEPQCRSKNIQLKTRIDPLLPSVVYTDQHRFRQILLNLLSNALKYYLLRFTTKGSITVVALQTTRNQLQVNVEDSGIGIKKSDLSVIFTLFGKLVDSSHLNPQGCGLGLSISNLLVRKLGGCGFSVCSQPGKGSIFSFCIDLFCTKAPESEYLCDSPDEELDTQEGCISQAIPETTGWFGSYMDASLPKILIVDDSSFNRVVAEKLIALHGFQSVQASNGYHALELLQKAGRSGHCFSLVLMDVEMPGIDGLETTREIRKLQREEKLPERIFIIGCSANCTEEDRERAALAGMDDFLEKPIIRSQLFTVIDNHVV